MNWPESKKNTPFGVLPILTHHKPNGDELEIPETGSFVRYLGRLFGLDGDTLEEQVTVDVFYQAAADNILNICFQELWNKPDPTDKDVINKCFAKLEPFFDGFEKYLVKNGSNGYVIKEKVHILILFFLFLSLSLVLSCLVLSWLGLACLVFSFLFISFCVVPLFVDIHSTHGRTLIISLRCQQQGGYPRCTDPTACKQIVSAHPSLLIRIHYCPSSTSHLDHLC